MRWLVMREIVLLLAAGIVIGIPITLLGSRLIRNALYGLLGIDPVSFAASIALLLAVATLTGYFPREELQESIQ